MRATGIVRKLDQLGRIVLPMELRRALDVSSRDGLEIFIDDSDRIHLRKYVRGCVFCGEFSEDLLSYNGKPVCGTCRDELTEIGIKANQTSETGTRVANGHFVN